MHRLRPNTAQQTDNGYSLYAPFLLYLRYVHIVLFILSYNTITTFLIFHCNELYCSSDTKSTAHFLYKFGV